MVSFSLILEHVEQLEPIFREAGKVLGPGGYIYVGELHPFKQYTGTSAKFTTEEGEYRVNAFLHHLTDFTYAAQNNGLYLQTVQEYFDNNDHTLLPGILALLFQKPA